jgi:hypothetical protein
MQPEVLSTLHLTNGLSASCASTLQYQTQESMHQQGRPGLHAQCRGRMQCP